MQDLPTALRAGQPVAVPTGATKDLDAVLTSEWATLWSTSAEVLPFSFGRAGIIREVEKLSEGRLKLGLGSLYGALDRLSEQNLIRTTRTEVVKGRLRRYYAIKTLA